MKVYLNYIPYDYNFAVQIALHLEDKRRLLNIKNPEGTKSWEEIVERISESDVLIYFLSPEALLDPFWQDQLNEALKRNIPTIGLMIREIDTILPAVGDRQPIDMTRGEYSRHLKELDALIDNHLRQDPFGSLDRSIVGVIGILAILVIVAFFILFQENDELSQFDQTRTSLALLPTYTETQIHTLTATSSSTPTLTYTATLTNTSTLTSTIPTTATQAPIPIVTYTLTRIPSNTPTRTEAATASRTFSPTNRLTLTRTKTPTSTSTKTHTPTATPSSTYTRTFTATFTTTSTVTPTIDPNSVVCPGAPESQLLVGDEAIVIHVSGVGLRAEPNTTSSLIEYLPLGTEMLILDGPVCEQSFRWWTVETQPGDEGWVAEGDTINYYIVSLEDN